MERDKREQQCIAVEEEGGERTDADPTDTTESESEQAFYADRLATNKAAYRAGGRWIFYSSGGR